ncbi:MAG: hypothetical protein WAL36_14835 [Pseudolabrys sp.]|jgi:hypothetical protein
MPIDLGQVDWLYVIVMAILVFVATFVGGVLSFGRRWIGATLSTLLFVALFVFWTYYPHRVPLLPKTITLPNAPTTTAAPPPPPAAPAAPQRPKNPVTDITPRNPVTDVTPPAAAPTPSTPATPATPPAAPAR